MYLHNLVFILLSFLLCKCECGPAVVIIGAGPAGIAAATKLLENSITNITVLEAEGRIGGRINSVEFGDGFVDVGAEYCHGQTGNVVYELVKDLNVLQPVSEEFQVQLYYSNGSKINDAVRDELQDIILTYDKNDDNFTTKGLNVEKLFNHKFKTTILNKYRNDPETFKVVKEAVRLAEKVTLMIDGAFSWSDTSTTKHYKRCDGHQLLVWNGHGYKTILDVLMKSYPNPAEKLPIDDKIHLNKKVTKIIWNRSRDIQVETADNGSFTADHVIFTPSVGVLKEQRDSLFNPELPSAKLDAIEAVGIGGVMKIILHFPHRWWVDDDVLWTFIWSQEDLLNIIKEFPKGPVKNGVSWVASIAILAKVPGNPNVLIAWVVGELLPQIEQTPIEILKEGSFYLMKKFLGKNYNVTEPDEIIKSGWRSNVNFRGTYSYERAGVNSDSVSYQSELAAPLKNRDGKPILLFAGEATNPIHYSTVHGAVETGFREAQRIIDLYKSD